MTFEESLAAKWAATSGLTALVPAARLYPDAAPQGVTDDYVVYELSTRADPPPIDGTTNGLVKDTAEFTIYSRNRLTAAAVRDAVITAFNGLAARGTWGGSGGLAVRACVCEQAASNHDPAQDGSETSDRLVRVTLNVFWKR